jgi:hypothetical protein
MVTELGKTKPPGRTTRIHYSPKLYTLRFLVTLFGISRSTEIRIKPDPTETVDIEIWLGSDWTDKLQRVINAGQP